MSLASVIQVWLLEKSAITAACIGALGLVLFLTLNRRGQLKRGVVAALIAFALAAVILLVGRFVETTAERLSSLTRQFVEAVATADRAAADRLVSERLVISTAGADIARLDKQWLLDIIDGFDNIIESYTVFREEAEVTDPSHGQIVLAVRVRTTALGGGITPTSWDLFWQKERDDQWRIVVLNCRTIYGDPPPASWIEHARRLSR